MVRLTQNMSRKTKKNVTVGKDKTMKGEDGVISMLNLSHDGEHLHSSNVAEEESKSSSQLEELCSNNETGTRKSCFPQKQLSIVDCFHSTTNQIEPSKFDNVFSMCISFIMKSSEPVVIRPGCTIKVKTDFLFKSFEPRHFKSLKKQSEEVKFENLFSRMKYHIWNLDCWNTMNQKVYVKYQEGFMKDVVDHPFEVEITNQSSNDFNLEPEINVCKIYFYAL